jgi:hypothetical protein
MGNVYTQQTWADLAAGNTAINATRLNHLEAGVKAVDTSVPAAGTTSGTYAAGDDSRIVNAVLTTNLAALNNVVRIAATIPPTPAADDVDGDYKLHLPTGNLYKNTGGGTGGTWAQVNSLVTNVANYCNLPEGWDTVSSAAIRTAIAGPGVYSVCIEGDSVTAGQGAGTQTDALRYGFAGRLKTLMAALFSNNSAGQSFMWAGVNSAALTMAAPPASFAGSLSSFDGGTGQVDVPSSVGAADFVIQCPVDQDTGQNPTSVDLYTIDYNGAASLTWQWKIDSGTATTVTTTGGNNTAGNGVLRKTTITLDGASSHVINLGTQSGGNAIMIARWTVNYGTRGLMLHRNGVQGWRVADFMTGGTSTGGQGGRLCATPDHIQPWAGYTTAYNTAGAGFPAPHLTILQGGLNDCTYGTRRDAYRRYFARRVHAARRGRPNASVMLLDSAYPSIYSDNPVGGRPYNYQDYKQIKRDCADDFACAYLDIDSLFGETPVANGWMLSGDIHPTQNGNGAGGGDGHLLMAQTLFNIITAGAL